MKKIIAWILLQSFLLYIISGNITVVYAQKASNNTVAILNMESRGGVSPNEAATLTDRLRTELVNLNVYTVLERGQMNSILDEQGFNISGCTSSECAVEAGRLLGVQQMIAGDVGKVGKVLTIDIRVFDVETGKILKAFQFDHEGDVSELLLLMKRIARSIAGFKDEETGGFPWLWASVGAAVILGGTAALLLGGGGDNGTPTASELPNPNWPPSGN